MRTRARAWALKIALAVATLLLCFVAIQVAAREFSLDVTRGLFNRAPITYRAPTVPIGEAFFRRDGPAEWHGQAIREMLQLAGQKQDYYANEPVVTVRYDAQGFRNEPPLDAWDVVVAGDSFTELGYLPYDDLFTTRAAALLGMRVKNLGVGYTGTLTQVDYIREFGCHPGAKDAVLAFYEGNDLWDTLRETQRVSAVRGGAPHPVVPTIVTPLDAVMGLAGRAWRRPQGIDPNAVFITPTGEIPVTVLEPPPDVATYPDAAREAERAALAQYVEVAKRCGMTPWLIMMPHKQRVLNGHLRFLDSAGDDVKRWKPSDVPAFIQRLCAELGIRYLDPTPELAAMAARGVLPYNHVFDTHYSAEGSRMVGEVLAEGLASDFPRGSR